MMRLVYQVDSEANKIDRRSAELGGVFHDLWDEARVTGAHICNRTEAGCVFSMEISQHTLAEWAPLFSCFS